MLQVSFKPGSVYDVRCPGSTVYQYLGIPFAEPPTGERLFVGSSPFEGTYAVVSLDATKFAPVYIQFGALSTKSRAHNLRTDGLHVLRGVSLHYGL